MNCVLRETKRSSALKISRRSSRRLKRSSTRPVTTSALHRRGLKCSNSLFNPTPDQPKQRFKITSLATSPRSWILPPGGKRQYRRFWLVQLIGSGSIVLREVSKRSKHYKTTKSLTSGYFIRLSRNLRGTC